jgi:FMN reductase [NAD(P)H]
VSGSGGPIAFVRSILRILVRRPRIPASLEDNQPLRAVLERRSVRRFARKEIPDHVFDAILEAGRLSPSTVNLQTWSFGVFGADSWRETFGRPLPFRGQRAVVVMGDVHRGRSILDALPRSPLVEYTVAVINASLAAMNMTLAAKVLGVASVMLSETGRTGLLDAGYLRKTLELPGGVFPLMTIVFGYARGPRPPMPPKLPLREVCFEKTYKEADASVMEDWLAQMKAGYKAYRPLSSFEEQLGVYAQKIGQAEADLRAMVRHQNGDF